MILTQPILFIHKPNKFPSDIIKLYLGEFGMQGGGGGGGGGKEGGHAYGFINSHFLLGGGELLS